MKRFFVVAVFLLVCSEVFGSDFFISLEKNSYTTSLGVGVLDNIRGKIIFKYGLEFSGMFVYLPVSELDRTYYESIYSGIGKCLSKKVYFDCGLNFTNWHSTGKGTFEGSGIGFYGSMDYKVGIHKFEIGFKVLGGTIYKGSYGQNFLDIPATNYLKIIFVRFNSYFG